MNLCCEVGTKLLYSEIMCSTKQFTKKNGGLFKSLDLIKALGGEFSGPQNTKFKILFNGVEYHFNEKEVIVYAIQLAQQFVGKNA